jgi:NAD(P)-dependent dehydrogenase (short-subunit alcohol dehydrogenase family)
MDEIRPESILLTDRVAIVTGAGAGIGKAIALALARFGAHVAICDRNEAALDEAVAELEATGQHVVGAHLDVRHADDVARFMDDVRGRFGRVDILVNNVGGTFYATFLDTNARGEDALIKENFTSATDMIRKTVPLMPASGGVIINVTSIEGWRACPGMAIYGAMKAGLENLTMSLALELGDRSIRVNCVSPDAIATPGAAEVGSENQTPFMLAGQVRPGLLPTTPLRRSGTSEDVAAAVVFLASELAGFITGTTIRVDGGNYGANGWFRRQDVVGVT